jgi:membrane protease YdiL (CAAX protease family)
MGKSDQHVTMYSSARSGRGRTIYFAPPLLIYALFSASILLQILAGYVIHHISFTFGMLLNQIGTLLLPVLIVIKLFGLTRREVLPFKRASFLQIVLSIIMMLALAIITDYLVFVTEWALPVTQSLDEIYKEMMQVNGAGSYIQKFAILCILPSFCEEIFFRGFSQTGLGRYYGKTVGVFITAAMFAVAHLSPWYTHLYFILGLFLGWIFVTSGSLWIPIICHVINNAWTFTSNAVGWKLPLGGEFAWVNIPVLGLCLIVFIGAVYYWNRIKTDGCKNHAPQSQMHQ